MACTPRLRRFLPLQGVVVRSGGIAWARRGLVRTSLRGFSAARSAGRWRAGTRLQRAARSPHDPSRAAGSGERTTSSPLRRDTVVAPCHGPGGSAHGALPSLSPSATERPERLL